MVVPNNLEKLSNKKKETENKNQNHTHLSNQSNDSETTNETNYKSREPTVFSFKNKITKDIYNDNHEDTKHHTSEEYKQHKKPNSNKSNDGNNTNNFEFYSPKQFPWKEKEVYVFKVESQHNESTQSELEFVIYIPVNP